MTPPQPPSAVVFDLDGTLVHLGVDWIAVKARLRALLGTDDELSPTLPAIDRLATTADLRRRALALVDESEVAASERLSGDPELEMILRQLRDGGSRLAVVTLQGRRAAEIALARTGILHALDAVLTRDDVADRNEQVARAFKALGADPSTSVVVGDRPADMEAGRRLGCFRVAVGSRPGVDADVTIDDVHAIMSAIMPNRR